MSQIESKTSSDGSVIDFVDGVTQIQTLLVNMFFVRSTSNGGWVIVDAGIPGFTKRIFSLAEEMFGDRAPQAIILTHGHFDHVGMIQSLLEKWDVPVYAHLLELPYLTGQSKYPPADPSVGGGMMARTSRMLPRGPIDLGDRVFALPTDGTVPGMPGWQWIHTPGHTPGHVSLWRESDRTLIAGDAFVTQKQESLIGVMTNRKAIHGPPTYYTTDWPNAAESVNQLRKLRKLRPAGAATGHGLPLYGTELHTTLDTLADHFWEKAVPRKGRYVPFPARADESGVTYIPPKPPISKTTYVALGTLALAAAAFMAYRKSSGSRARFDPEQEVDMMRKQGRTLASNECKANPDLRSSWKSLVPMALRWLERSAGSSFRA